MGLEPIKREIEHFGRCRQISYPVPAAVAIARTKTTVLAIRAMVSVIPTPKMAVVYPSLKILLTNHCIFDCAYCVTGKSNDIRKGPPLRFKRW